MTYQTKHWVIDWEKVQTVEDIKALLMMLNLSIHDDADVSSIRHLLWLEDKPVGRMVMD